MVLGYGTRPELTVINNIAEVLKKADVKPELGGMQPASLDCYVEL